MVVFNKRWIMAGALSIAGSGLLIGFYRHVYGPVEAIGKSNLKTAAQITRERAEFEQPIRDAMKAGDVASVQRLYKSYRNSSVMRHEGAMHYELGQFYLKHGFRAEAKTHLEAVLKDRHSFDSTQGETMAMWLRSSDDDPQTKRRVMDQWLANVHEQYPQTADDGLTAEGEVNYSEGAALCARCDFQSAEPYLERAAELCPQSVQVFEKMAENRQLMGDLDGSKQAYAQAYNLETDPDKRQIYAVAAGISPSTSNDATISLPSNAAARAAIQNRSRAKYRAP